MQAELALALPAAVSAGPAPPPLQQALAAVPRAKPAGTDPAVERIAVELSATPPRIVIDARFPGSQKAADAFLEAPDGLWIPFAKVADGAPAGLSRFLVDLSDGAEIPDLKGKEIRLTLVGERGQSETSFKLE